MNYRMSCDQCGSQPCMCQEFECALCEGTGDCWNNNDPTSGQRVDCEACKGTGWVKCSGPLPDGGCRYQRLGAEVCECERAWDEQQERNASEPPMLLDEQHRLAWEQKQRLRS